MYPLPPRGSPSKVIGSPQASEIGAKFQCQFWLPWMATGIERDGLVDGDHRGARLDSAGNLALPGALGEHPERVTVAHDLAHRPHRVAVGLAAAHGERAEAPHELAEAGHAVRLHLGHEVEGPRAGRAERRRIEPAEVVRGDYQPTPRRHPLGSVDAERGDELHRGADGEPADRPDGVGPVHRRASTSSAMRSTT